VWTAAAEALTDQVGSGTPRTDSQIWADALAQHPEALPADLAGHGWPGARGWVLCGPGRRRHLAHAGGRDEGRLRPVQAGRGRHDRLRAGGVQAPQDRSRPGVGVHRTSSVEGQRRGETPAFAVRTPGGPPPSPGRWRPVLAADRHP